MFVGFTGTQQGMTPAQEEAVRALLGKVTAAGLHHGDCIGADAQAHAIAHELGIRVFLHPPDDPRKRAFCKGAVVTFGERPYLERNRDIVTASQVLIACPKEETGEEMRSGTWATVRYARKARIVRYIVRPSGKVERESIR